MPGKITVCLESPEPPQQTICMVLNRGPGFLLNPGAVSFVVLDLSRV